MIYLNNAATTYPKPAVVLETLVRAAGEAPLESDRGSMGSETAGPEAARAAIARCLGVGAAERLIFCPSATFALNLVIHGCCRAGHVVTTALEHNSVLRPLAQRQHDNRLRVSIIEPAGDGRIAPQRLAAELRFDTRLIAVTHASNVTGAIQPIDEIAAIAAARGIPLLVDASQSAGVIELPLAAPGRVFIAMAGHKGLYGPPGTALLLVPDGDAPPLIQGGTGIRSEAVLQPNELPLRYEAGTPNGWGIRALAAGVAWVYDAGVAARGAQRQELVRRLRTQLRELPEIRLSPLPDEDGRAGIVSFTTLTMTPGEIGFALRTLFEIEVRTGLHCAPQAHTHLGTRNAGTVRVSVGAFNTAAEIDAFVAAMRGLLLHATACDDTHPGGLLRAVPQPGMGIDNTAGRSADAASGDGRPSELLPGLPPALLSD